MKASTPELMKFQKLQRRLKESRRGIIGLLEGLWIAVAKNCPRGNIGRFSNEEIAIMVDWENDADELVAALVDCACAPGAQTPASKHSDHSVEPVHRGADRRG